MAGKPLKFTIFSDSVITLFVRFPNCEGL